MTPYDCFCHYLKDKIFNEHGAVAINEYVALERDAIEKEFNRISIENEELKDNSKFLKHLMKSGVESWKGYTSACVDYSGELRYEIGD